MRLRYEFVDYVPKELDDGVLYVSIRFGTVVHRCAWRVRGGGGDAPWPGRVEGHL